MAIQRIVTSSFVASVLFAAGSAFAHQPPVLTAAQRASERAVACEGATAEPGAGYRNSFVRFGDARRIARERFAKPRAGAGYRDTVVRFGPASPALVACTPTKTPRMSASR